jgi:hypothetical protein
MPTTPAAARFDSGYVSFSAPRPATNWMGRVAREALQTEFMFPPRPYEV